MLLVIGFIIYLMYYPRWRERKFETKPTDEEKDEEEN